MFGLENRGETLICMSCHFDEIITILISHFLRFGALKILTGDFFCVLRLNKIIYSKQNIGCLFILVSFPALFLQQISPFTLYRELYKWRMGRITYQQVHD